MNTGSRSTIYLFAILVISLSVCATRAVSDTIPYTEALISTFNPVESATPIVTHSAPATTSTVTYSQSGTWGSVSGFAAADLATGQLKAQAGNAPMTGYSPYMQTNAWFGDGFRTNGPGGQPFTWLPNSGARFLLDLTGSSVTSSDPHLGNLGFGQVGGFVLLSLYQPGTLDPAGKLVGGANNLGYYLYLLGNPNQNLTYTDQAGGFHSLIPTGFYNDLTHDIHITQDFQPNGDFDWAVLIGASGQISGPQFYNMDFSHTLTVGYAGPGGTTTTAVSGLFHNFQSLPEPSGFALLATGLIGVFGRRRLLAGRHAKSNKHQASQ